jgi:hypothetical protein
MIRITEANEGCILPVRAQPGARQTRIVGEHAGALKVAVTAPPNQGKANQALAAALAEALQLKRSQVELVSGHSRRDKRFFLRGLTQAELEARLRQLMKKDQPE